MKPPAGRYVWTTKVGERGQIVIPKEAREVFDIHPGETLLLFGDINQGIAIVKGDVYAQLAEMVFKSDQEKEGDE